MKTDKKIKLLDFKLTKNLWASLFWVYKSRFTGNWMDFVKHKEYNHSDPIKNIDWKTAWKWDKIQSKVFEDERDLKVLFLIDISKSMGFWFTKKTKKDLLEEIFYSIALSASLGWDSIGALLYSWEKKIFLDYEKWFSNIFRVINELNNKNTFSENNKNKTNEALNYLQKRNIKNNLIFILTDDTDILENRNLKLLSITNEIIFFNIFDYFENNLTNANSTITLQNWDNFLNISLNDFNKIEKYKNIRQEKINLLDNYLKRNKISYKAFDTDSDTFRQLYLFFSKERVKVL